MQPITLLFDHGPAIGLGHERRMIALQRAFAFLGQASELAPIGPATHWGSRVFVDSYLTRAEAFRRPDVCALGAIEDLGRDLAVDLLVTILPPVAGQHAPCLLTGIEYALLDPALADTVADPADRFDVLVAGGGADRAGTAASLAGEIAALLGPDRVRLAIGPDGSQFVPPGVQPVVTRSGLGPHLARAGIVVTSGGVTLLESLALGRPTLAYLSAENQRPYLDAAGAAGAALVEQPARIAALVPALLQDRARRDALTERATAYVDGKGAHRVAAAFLGLGTDDLRDPGADRFPAPAG